MYVVKTGIHHSGIEGDGVFAGEFIPQGTIVYFYDDKNISVSSAELSFLPEKEKNKIIKYGVQDEAGNWMLGEGAEKLNHSCDANVLSLFVDDIYCEIAIRDILEGEEITADYGLFFSSFPYRMECRCNSSICRRRVSPGEQIDIQTQRLWYQRISEASSRIFDVKQNLFSTEDEIARRLTLAIKSKHSSKILPYIKFSLISGRSP